MFSLLSSANCSQAPVKACSAVYHQKAIEGRTTEMHQEERGYTLSLSLDAARGTKHRCSNASVQMSKRRK